MKYLKKFESTFNGNIDTSLINEIKDCFIYFYDNLGQDENSGIRVKPKGRIFQYKQLNSKQFITKDIDYEVMIIPKLGKQYHEINGFRLIEVIDNFSEELENSILLTSGVLNLKLKGIVIEYVRNLDYNNVDKGPGVVNRSFIDGGIEPEYVMLHKSTESYDIKEVYKFINFLGNKLRYIKIYFSYY